MEAFITCSCKSEGIYVVKYKDEDEIYISFFSQGYTPNRMNVWQKIRYIFKVLRGKPYEDQIVLDKKTQVELVKVLNKCIYDRSQSNSKGNRKTRS
jgi:hypothetical protein